MEIGNLEMKMYSLVKISTRYLENRPVVGMMLRISCWYGSVSLERNEY